MPEVMKKQRKLRNLIINPLYQMKYIFWLSASGMLLVAMNASVFYYYMRENYSILVELSPMDDATKAQLYSELNQIILRLLGLSCLFMLIVAIIGLVYSHRTAGPLYHFKSIFARIRAGDRSARVRLRPKDDFRDVAESFNEMMDSLSK